jgi:hypothetical protein
MWAIHVLPEPVRPSAATRDVARRLQSELEAPGLRPNHLSAEQLGLVAIRELEQGRLQDAVLWLSMASYRYHQQLMSAVEHGIAGERSLPPNVNRRAFTDLVFAEIKIYRDFGFGREIAALDARLYGRGSRETALAQQFSALGKTSEIEQEALRDAMSELRASAAASAPSDYPELVEAFRLRLEADFRADPKDGFPAITLAHTPIDGLQKEAVLLAPTYFHPATARFVAEDFPLERANMITALGDSRSKTRANAAAALALAPSEESREAIEAQQASETDPQVKLVLAYALVHHGLTSNVDALTQALTTCWAPACTLPVMLAEWLPDASKRDLDQALLARIVAGKQYEPDAHLFAALTLGEVQRSVPLTPATVEALIVAGRRRADAEEWAAEVAWRVLRDATALSHEDVVARLRTALVRMTGPDASSPGPLLARLASVGTRADLPLLARALALFGQPWRPEAQLAVEAAAQIPGPEADAKLIGWFNSFAAGQTPIAIAILGRPSRPPGELERAAATAGARTRMVIKALTNAPDAEATVLGYLRDGTPTEKLAAAEVAGLTNQVSARAALLELLQFQDLHYYPNDALVRHQAIVSLLRIAIFNSAKPSGGR